MSKAIAGAERLFAPSDFIKRCVEKWYGGPLCEVIPHWCIQYDEALKEDSEENSREFAVAVIGAVTEIKGSRELSILLDNATKHKGLKWHIFGSIGDGNLLNYEGGSIFFHGRYERKDIIRLLKEHDIKVVCLLSKTPESFGYTLTESWLAGCPVICTNCGAVAERVTETGAGWVLGDENPMSEADDILASILEDRSLLNEKKRNIPQIGNHEKEVIIEEYSKIYDGLIKKSRNAHHPTPNQSEKVLKAWKAQRDNSGFVIGDFAINVAVFTSKLYYDKGSGFSERECINTLIPAETDFTVSFIFPEPTICRQLRFDIADRYKCIVCIKSAVVKYEDGSEEHLTECIHNGTDDGAQIIFDTTDPNILWNVRDRAIWEVKCSGEWHIYPGNIIHTFTHEFQNLSAVAPASTFDEDKSLKCSKCILKQLKKYIKKIFFRFKRKR
jgi:hypothetical protein